MVCARVVPVKLGETATCTLDRSKQAAVVAYRHGLRGSAYRGPAALRRGASMTGDSQGMRLRGD